MHKQNKKATDIRKARQFANTFRFINDLVVFIDGG